MKPPWMTQAACRGLPASLFVPERGDIASIKTAKEICATCPVRDECRDYGLTIHRQADLDGIFGGLSKIERLRILRKENLPRRRQTPINQRNSYRIDDHMAKPCGTVSAYSRHIRNNERPCDACRRAWAQRAYEYRVLRRKNRKGEHAA